MTPHKPNPAGKGGAGSDVLDSASRRKLNPDNRQKQAGPFLSHRHAALALLNNCPALSIKEAGFLGHVAVTLVVSEKQQHWLGALLSKHQMPPLKKAQGHG